jgi:tetratricopeptide (TPR) repeat protein
MALFYVLAPEECMNVRLACAMAAAACVVPGMTQGIGGFDPLLDGGAMCGPPAGGQPAVLRALVLAKTETEPFQPVPATPATGEAPPKLYPNLGTLHFPAGTRSGRAQQWFDQGIRLSFAFNHAEARRAFREAQKIDPACALCYWGEALVLGPNVNVPMMPEANEPALAALAKAAARAKTAPARDRALIEALATRYSADAKAERPKLDAAYAQAMAEVAKAYPEDTILALYAEALMDTQPWDYWEAGGAKPKGNGAAIVTTLETVLARNPTHPGAIHLYIHAVEASAHPERALPYANRLGAQMPGAGHVVHMPAHIYYRVGMYRESLDVNRKAIGVDERYFRTSPSDPVYKGAYYPHNIHFLMVSAQMGGEGGTALAAAAKLDASMPVELVRQFAIMQPVKAAPYATHAQFSAPATILALPAPPPDLVIVDAMYRYARAVAFARKGDAASAQGEIDALARIEQTGNWQPFAEWGVPAKEIVQTARLVATGRLADAKGDLASAAKAYDDAVFIEDALGYMEPPYWYYPVRQSLGGVLLRQGKLDEAEKAFRESLARVRNNGWALAGLAATYKRKGDAAGEKSAHRAFGKAWLGPAGGPDLAAL